MPPPSAPSTRAATGAGRVLAWLSENVAVLLTLAGILLYGGSRVALEAFYQPLGTTASEVGVSYLEIVALAGISIGANALFYSTLGAVLVAVMYGLSLLFTRVLRRFRSGTFTYLDYLEERQIPYTPLRTMVGFGVVLVFAQVFVEWISSTPPRPPPWYELTLTLLLLVVAPILFPLAFAIGATRRAPDSPSPPGDFMTDMVSLLRGDTAKLLLALMPFVLIGTTVLASSEQGARYAEDVKAGREVQPAARGAIPFQASCVTLVPVGGQNSPAAERFRTSKLLYLGQSGGVAVLYQVGAGAVRVPRGSFTLAPCRN